MSQLPPLVSAHQATGRYVDVGGVRTFVADMGVGESVLCLHGVPSSSFLYRKVLPELSQKG
ncbi:MAG: alpha/beta hydrolase, partial [Bacteroidota bacterium]